MQASATLRKLLLLPVFSSSIQPSEVNAQWAAMVEIGAERFWGGSVENTPERRSFRPYRPTTFGIGLHGRSGSLGFGIDFKYAEAGLALEGDEGAVVANGVFTMYRASPEVSYTVASVGAGELRLHAGPLFELWRVIDEDSRTRVGFQSAVSLDVPLGGRLDGSVVAGLAVTPSPFEAEDLGPEYDRRALWRRRFAVGLGYRL
jgi:hypothetical protein